MTAFYYMASALCIKERKYYTRIHFPIIIRIRTTLT